MANATVAYMHTEFEEPCKICRNNFSHNTSEYYHAPLMWTPKENK